MISNKYHRLIYKAVKKIQRFANRVWFPPLLMVLAMIDIFLIIIPTDGILISSSMLIKKRWMLFALSAAIGATVGSLFLVHLVESHGLLKILEFYPGMDQGSGWQWTLKFFNQYGLLVAFLVGITPFSQQPVLIIAAISNISFLPLALVVFVSRLIKCGTMAYVASHAPRLLRKFWGVKNELKDAGIKIN